MPSMWEREKNEINYNSHVKKLAWMRGELFSIFDRLLWKLTKTEFDITMFYKICNHYLFSLPFLLSISPCDFCRRNTFGHTSGSLLMSMTERWIDIHLLQTLEKLTMSDMNVLWDCYPGVSVGMMASNVVILRPGES